MEVSVPTTNEIRRPASLKSIVPLVCRHTHPMKRDRICELRQIASCRAHVHWQAHQRRYLSFYLSIVSVVCQKHWKNARFKTQMVEALFLSFKNFTVSSTQLKIPFPTLVTHAIRSPALGHVTGVPHAILTEPSCHGNRRRKIALNFLASFVAFFHSSIFIQFFFVNNTLPYHTVLNIK